MRTFLVSYDLVNPSQNRNAINSAIMMLGATWARPLANTWYIRADLDETDIESVLAGLLDDEDGLIVQAVRDAAHLANTSLRWFKQRPLAANEQTTNIVAFPAAPAAPNSDTALPLATAV